MRNIYNAVAMTTGKKLLRNSVGIAAALCAAAVPGYCGTAFLNYTGAGGSGNTITVNGNSNTETLSAFTAPITVLQISNSTDSADNAYWNITGGTETIAAGTGVNAGKEVLTVTGTLGSCDTGLTPNCATTTGNNLGNITGSQTWETIVYGSVPFASPFSGTGASFNTNTGGVGSQTSFGLNLGAASSVADLSTLLTDLSMSTSTSQVNSGGTNAGTTTPGSGPNYGFTVSSSTLGVTITSVSATPEPVSFLLLGTGLMGVALVARRRRASQN